MKMNFVSKTWLTVWSAVFLASIGAKTWAQTIEEVVVISSKQAAGISTQDLPGSVVTFNETALKNSFTVDLVDIGKMVANAELNNVGTYASYPNFFIRGMGVNGSTRTNDPKVGIFVDEIGRAHV